MSFSGPGFDRGFFFCGGISESSAAQQFTDYPKRDNL
jgi:hypothetical protein